MDDNDETLTLFGWKKNPNCFFIAHVFSNSCITLHGQTEFYLSSYDMSDWSVWSKINGAKNRLSLGKRKYKKVKIILLKMIWCPAVTLESVKDYEDTRQWDNLNLQNNSLPRPAGNWENKTTKHSKHTSFSLSFYLGLTMNDSLIKTVMYIIF